MSNNYFNFNIPEFNSQNGSDWTAFQTIINEWVDYYFAKTYQLYWLRKPDRLNTQAIEIALQLRGIKYTSTDTVKTKRFKLRHFNTSYMNKGLMDTYLDLAENITGIRGTIGYSTEGWIWDDSKWTEGESPTDAKWGGIASDSIYNIFFNIKTTNEDEIDAIETLIREKTNRPAFYQIFLIDDEQNTLRTI
jgi:hypothetical protein